MWINKIIYLAITIYAAVLSVLYLQVQVLYVFVVLLLFPVLLFIQGLLIKRKLSISLTSTSKLAIERNDGIHVQLAVSNGSLIPVGCIKIKVVYENTFAEEGGKQVFLLSLGGRKKNQINFTLGSLHTGLVKVKIERINVYDFIRLFSRKIKSNLEITVPVLPEVYSIGSDVTIREPDFVESDVFSKNKPGDDPSEVFDIREYKEGDRIHRIHWKLSSKKDTVMVKDYSLPISNAATILVDTSLPNNIPDKLQYLDALMETTASISYHLLVRDYHHYVAWYEQAAGNYVSSNLEDLNDLYYMMGNILRSNPSVGKNDILDAHQVYGEGKQISQVYYISHQLTEEQMGMLMDSYGHAQIEVILIGENIETDENMLGKRLHKQVVVLSNIKSSIESLQL